MENSDDLNTVDVIVQRARTAQSSYEREGAQELFDLAAQAVGWALMKPEHNTALAELAVKETGLGNVSETTSCVSYLHRCCKGGPNGLRPEHHN